MRAPFRNGNPRRELLGAVVVCGLGAGLVLIASARTWVRVTVDLPRPIPDATYALAGGELAPLAGALGLAGLAGLAGLVGTRGYARLVVGVLLGMFGAAIAYASLLGTGATAVRHALATEAVLVRGGVTGTSTGWWAVSLAGGVLVGLAGVLAAARGRNWPGLSRKYEAPGTSPSRPGEPGPDAAHRTDADDTRGGAEMWDAVDRGTDPTA